MAQVIGNIQPSVTHGAVRGVGGINPAPIPRSWTQVAGQAGEVVRLSVTQLVPSLGEFATSAQSSVDLDVRYSLANPELATNPAHFQNVPWTAPEVIAANEIVALNKSLPFVNIEITFSADGIFTVYAR